MGYPEPDEEERSRIPSEILEQLIHLQWEITEFGCNWDLIDQVYGKAENRRLLSNASSYGYRMIYQMLMEHCVLAIARFTDPPKTSGKRNLNLLSLKQCIEDHADGELVDLTCDSFDALRQHAEECRIFRHKALAHSDYDTALGHASQPSVTIRSINSALEQARKIINVIRDHFGVRHFCFDMVVGADASGVVASLKTLDEYRQLWDDAHRLRINDDAELRRRFLRIRPH